MKVRCACCGYEATVEIPVEWIMNPGRMPDIWMCEVCQEAWDV